MKLQVGCNKRLLLFFFLKKMPQNKKAQDPRKRPSVKKAPTKKIQESHKKPSVKKTPNKKTIRNTINNRDTVETSVIKISNMVADAMTQELDRIVEQNDGLIKAKKMVVGIVGGVDRAAKQFVKKYLSLTPAQQRLLFKEMKKIAEGSGSHGIDVDYQDNILEGIF